MTSETQKALEAFVLQVIDAAKSGASWTAEQTPLLVQEWLRWQLWSTGLISGLGVALLIASLAFVVAEYRRDGKEYTSKRGYTNVYDFGDEVVRLVPAFFLGFIGLAITGTNLPSFIKVLVAPRVVVFEKFMEIIK